MKSGLVEGKVCAGYINSGERMLAGGGCVVRWLNYGEAAAVGGDDLFGGFPPAEGLCPELGVSW